MILRAGLRLVEVADDVIELIVGYSRGEESNREAGGIFVGAYRGPHVEIVSLTTPKPKDTRTWSMFDRNDPAHGEVALKYWRESGRTLTYVGEWHTHPEAFPTPSFLDRTAWRRAGRRHKTGPLVFAIRGYEGWWWSLQHQKKLGPLSPIPVQDELFDASQIAGEA